MLALAEAISFHWVDALGLAILLLFAFLGARRGLWWQVVRLLGAVAVVAVAVGVLPMGVRGVLFVGLCDGLAHAWLPCLAELADSSTQ